MSKVRIARENGISSYEFYHELEEAFGEEKVQEMILSDGIYFSKSRPLDFERGVVDIEVDSETDFFAAPYDTDKMFFWKGERPVEFEDWGGQGSYGCALTMKVERAGYYTVCFQND